MERRYHSNLIRFQRYPGRTDDSIQRFTLSMDTEDDIPFVDEMYEKIIYDIIALFANHHIVLYSISYPLMMKSKKNGLAKNVFRQPSTQMEQQVM